MKHTGFIAAVVGASVVLTAGFAQAQGPGGMRGGHMSFEALDADGNGEISREEMTNHRQVRFSGADADGNGALSRDEMIAAGQARVQEHVTAMIEAFDENGDGALSLDEMPGPRKPERAARFFDRMDSDDSGGISREEFAAAGDWMGRHGGTHKRWHKN